MSILKIVMAQINPVVGDIDGNTEKIIRFVEQAESQFEADIVVFPELTITGYPPEDLLLRSSIEKRVTRALDKLCACTFHCAVVVGYPKAMANKLYNMAGVIQGNSIVYEYAKQCLPNYQVFDEKRYFTPGDKAGIFFFRGCPVGISICEDIWEEGPLQQLKTTEAKLLLNLNGSPFHSNKQSEREELLRKRALDFRGPIVYVNQVGGQDELVFDGGSLAVNECGEAVARAPLFEESLTLVTYSVEDQALRSSGELLAHPVNPLVNIYQALVLGVRDYVNKNRFKGVLLGLSGGIDSALTLAVAVDALGPERVEAVMMPFKYTSQMSLNDAEDEATRLGVHYRVISIEGIYDAFLNALAPSFEGASRDTTEENIQARARGVLLMALSNKYGYLVLTTGNKSEMAVGYATLYGDMAGGLDVLKDVPKTTVFALAKYRNTVSEVIPPSVITRPPSAELAPDQKDEDSLPPYDVLDKILELYVEQDKSAGEIVAQGYDETVVQRVLRMVDINEYKRRQAPIGIRISRRAFGRDRRYPITNGWRIGD